METVVGTWITVLEEIVQNSSLWISVGAGMLIIILESIVPMLPLALFIAINMLVFGNIGGFVLSWIATILGCSLSFWIFRILKKRLPLKKHAMWMHKVGQISFSNLVLILSIPFTPAFSINIGAGLSDMKYSKYLFALIIAKLFLVYFWGFIGTTLMESMQDIGILCKLGSMTLIAFLLSKWITQRFHLQ